MDIWSQLIQGFVTAGTPVNLLWAFVGCALGTAVGVLPGIGPATAVAMLLPITAKVDATASMIFFAGIYYGADADPAATPRQRAAAKLEVLHRAAGRDKDLSRVLQMRLEAAEGAARVRGLEELVFGIEAEPRSELDGRTGSGRLAARVDDGSGRHSAVLRRPPSSWGLWGRVSGRRDGRGRRSGPGRWKRRG